MWLQSVLSTVLVTPHRRQLHVKIIFKPEQAKPFMRQDEK